MLPMEERLLVAGHLNGTQLDMALRHQKREGGRIGDVLIELGLVKPNVIATFLAEETATELVDLREVKPQPDLHSTMPEEIGRRFTALPLKIEDEVLTIVLGDPLNIVAIDMLEQITGMDIKVVTAPEADIVLAIDRLYAEADVIEESIDTIMDEQA